MFFRYVKAALRVQDSRETAPYIYGSNQQNSTQALEPLQRQSCIIDIILAIIKIDSMISKDERGFPLTQYITNGRISRGGFTFTHFKHHHRVLRLISFKTIIILENATALGSRIPPHAVLLHVNNTPVKLKIIFAI